MGNVFFLESRRWFKGENRERIFRGWRELEGIFFRSRKKNFKKERFINCIKYYSEVRGDGVEKRLLVGKFWGNSFSSVGYLKLNYGGFKE